MKLFKNKNNILMLVILSFLYISLDTANAAKPKEPILVIDKCPEFCPPGIKEPVLVIDGCPKFCPKEKIKRQPIKPIEMCAQVLIPVPGRPGYWYTNSCKNNIIGEPKIKSVKK
jgi:hypothetical protein